MPYRVAERSSKAFGELLKKTWGFVCDCTACTAESVAPAAQRKRREKLLREVSSFLSTHKFTQQYEPKWATVSRANHLYHDLDDAYDGNHFENLPRIGLVDLGIWLCQAYSTASTHQKSLEAAKKVLHHSGYHVKVEEETLAVSHTCASLSVHVVDAAVYAARAHSFMGQTELGKQYNYFARDLYSTLFGEMRGFLERYGNPS